METSNFVIDLLIEFLKENKGYTIFITILSLLVNFIHAGGISTVNAYLIESINAKSQTNTFIHYKYFVFIIFLFLILYVLYNYSENQFSVKLRNWVREELLIRILRVNNENMGEINYIKLNTPIKRISLCSYLIFSDILVHIIPNLGFVLIIGLYLFYINSQIGFIFLITNILFVALIYYRWEDDQANQRIVDRAEYANDAELLEILSNIDRIISRGQTNNESALFQESVKSLIQKSSKLHASMDMYGGAIGFVVSGAIVLMVYQSIQLFYANKISSVQFITIMTMLILYRDKLITLIEMIPHVMEFISRIEFLSKSFDDMNLNTPTPKYIGKHLNLEFNRITFKNVSFKYKANDTYAVDKVNVELISDGGKIIGITGISGRGKSTLIRLLLKLHSPETGEIFIDDMPISDLDPDYIRHNITYVNQNGKLFDRKVIENILYGCNHPNDCNSNLKRIYKYPKIKDMLQSIDLEKDCGALGENLSGGQRQIVNIISGVINNSKILILDEPTNALDPQLKKDVVQMIDDFAKEKNAIIIITHDKELLPLFNQVIYIS